MEYVVRSLSRQSSRTWCSFFSDFVPAFYLAHGHGVRVGTVGKLEELLCLEGTKRLVLVFSVLVQVLHQRVDFADGLQNYSPDFVSHSP